jgi:hypothetical protein
MLAIAVVGIPVGGALVRAWWTELDIGDRSISWYGALLGALGFGGGIVCFLGSPLVFFIREHIVFGKEFLQITNGKGTVTHQFPYRNIASVQVLRNQTQEGNNFVRDYIAIELVDPEDAQTRCPPWETNKKSFGCHYRILDGTWTDPLEKMCDRIAKRLPPHA